MAEMHEKDLEEARYVEDVAKSPDSNRSMDAGPDQLQTLDKPNGYEINMVTELSDAERKRIIRKIDWTLVPLLTFLYLVAFIDRSNSTSDAW
jgi:hypothetical protein